MFFVVGVHVLSTLWMLDDAFIPHRIVDSLLQIFFFCNPLFFMISGRFALQKQSTPTFKFYFKRLTTLLVPLVVYLCLGGLIENRVQGAKFSVADILRTTFVDNTSKYWFIYTLIGFVLVTPFIKRLLDSLSDKELKVFICLILVVMTGVTIEQSLNISTGIFSNVFMGLSVSVWLIFYILGFCLERLRIGGSQQKRVVLYILGVISFVAMMTLSTLVPTFNASNPNLLQLISCSALYTFITSFNIRNNKPLHFVGQRIFGVYFLQFTVLGVLNVLDKTNIVEGFGPYIGAVFAKTVAIYIISLIVATVVDLLVVQPITKSLQKFYANTKVQPERK
ncbi:hypothetical protein FACS1894125_0320 [Actinomycetota bacterium]|nr:hypothetical protein FACS1894125_0320 [Actinomycetota bacterium]